MSLRRLALLALLATLGVSGCREKRKPPSMSNAYPWWIPLVGRPVPGRSAHPAVGDSPIRELTTAELLAIAYKFHPQMGDPETYTIEAWDHAFWSSPEQIALSQVQRAGYELLPQWEELCRSARRFMPPGYILAERTYPRYFPTYMLVVDAPIAPGSIEEDHLVVHVSYLVPYYFYYELHSRRIDGRIQRDPLLYEASPVFQEVLAVIEREIQARYGYWRMSIDVAKTYVPDIYINGYHDWDKHPPTLQDALFTPQRW